MLQGLFAPQEQIFRFRQEPLFPFAPRVPSPFAPRLPGRAPASRLRIRGDGVPDVPLAFPLRGRCPSAHTGADEVSPVPAPAFIRLRRGGACPSRHLAACPRFRFRRGRRPRRPAVRPAPRYAHLRWGRFTNRPYDENRPPRADLTRQHDRQREGQAPPLRRERSFLRKALSGCTSDAGRPRTASPTMKPYVLSVRAALPAP